MGFNDILKCPGFTQGRFALPNEFDCPQCGESVEIWSDEPQRICKKCDTIVHNLNPLPKIQMTISSDRN